MNRVAEYTDLKVPSYALSYLVNSDASGLEDSDILAIDRWYDSFVKECKEGQHIIFAVNYDEEGNSESYFSNRPEFGLPSDVTDCTILIVE